MPSQIICHLCNQTLCMHSIYEQSLVLDELLGYCIECEGFEGDKLFLYTKFIFIYNFVCLQKPNSRLKGLSDSCYPIDSALSETANVSITESQWNRQTLQLVSLYACQSLHIYRHECQLTGRTYTITMHYWTLALLVVSNRLISPMIVMEAVHPVFGFLHSQVLREREGERTSSRPANCFSSHAQRGCKNAACNGLCAISIVDGHYHLHCAVLYCEL